MSDEKPSYGKVWARGYYDGLRAAEKNDKNPIGLQMNQGRFKSVLNGLSGVARKVFDSVPISEEWSQPQISMEMQRKHGAAPERRVMTGCLNNLVEAGIVVEPRPGQFRKIAVSREMAPAKSLADKYEKKGVEEMAVEKKNSETEGLGPLDRIYKLTDQLKDLADQIQIELLNAEKEVSDAEVSAKKLKQLQELLKSV